MTLDPAHPPVKTAAKAGDPLSDDGQTARFWLRAETAEAHERLDRLYSVFDLGRREDYGRFLQSHAIAFLPVETALQQAGAETLIPHWPATMRGEGLRQDITDLGLAVPPPAISLTFPTEADLLGGLYVLEGSRLGGAMLARTVAAGLPARFLVPGNAGAWRAFTTVLDARLQSSTDRVTAARSAIAVFDLFEQSARSFLETIRDA